MSEQRDPALEALFDAAREELPAEAFTSRTMAEVDRLRRRVVTGWSAIGVVLVAVVLLLVSSVQEAVLLLTATLDISLVTIDNELAAGLLSPLNSVAGAVALVFLVFYRLFRKIFK